MLMGVIVGLMFVTGVSICAYWARSSEKKEESESIYDLRNRYWKTKDELNRAIVGQDEYDKKLREFREIEKALKKARTDYWLRTRKRPTAILLLVLITASSCSPAGIISRKKYEGYTVVKSYPVDSLRDFHVIMNDKRYVEIYTPKWWKDMYQVGDTIK